MEEAEAGGCHRRGLGLDSENDVQAQDHLRTYGVVVVQGALPAEEARVALHAIQNWLAEWTSKGGCPNGNGLVAAAGGQCEGAWRA
jgi:hypothetical protein